MEDSLGSMGRNFSPPALHEQQTEKSTIHQHESHVAMTSVHNTDPRSSDPYQYSPLNEEAQEIRLLTLLPGTFDSEIHLCLTITPFTETDIPEFEGVSYAWGSIENMKNIYIGESGRKTLAVTQNLAEALPYFQYEDKPRVMWIDAICVDQQNLKERGHQVKRMVDIYSKAAQVLVWLGRASEDSLLAMESLDKITSRVRYDDTKKLLVATLSGHASWRT